MIKRFIADENGVTMVEFAVVSPVLLFLMMGIIEFGVLYHLQSLATNASNQAARLSITGGMYGDASGNRLNVIKESIKKTMATWFPNDEPTVNATCYSGFGGAGSSGGNGACGSSQVALYEVTYTWHTLTPVLGEIFADGKVPISVRVMVKNEAF